MTKDVVSTPDRWEPVKVAIQEFGSYLSPAVPPLYLAAAHDTAWNPNEWQRSRFPGYPCSLRGVYLFFDDTESLRWIGVATDCFDKRVRSHKDIRRRYTDIIAIDDEHLFLAPALEFFLIARLQPPENKVYRKHKRPSAER